MKALKPPFILMLICIVVSGLLVVAYNITYVDTDGVMTNKLSKAAAQIFPEGDFTLLTVTDEEGNVSSLTFDTYGDVQNVIRENTSGTILMQVVADGYNKDGMNFLIALDENGAVIDLASVSMGDTPGIGTKILEESFLSNFIGLSSSEGANDVDTVTAATRSSDGVIKAVGVAIDTYNDNKELIASK